MDDIYDYGECREARDALRFDLTQCADDLSSARKALGPPPPSPLVPTVQDGGPDFSRAAEVVHFDAALEAA